VEIRNKLQTLRDPADDVTLTRISTAIAKLQEILDIQRTNQTFEVSFPTPKLPHAWASAFFAALFAVLGHGIYQALAPDTIRRNTIEEFVRDARDDYREHPNEARMEEAYNILINNTETRPRLINGALEDLRRAWAAKARIDAARQNNPEESQDTYRVVDDLIRESKYAVKQIPRGDTEQLFDIMEIIDLPTPNNCTYYVLI